jgi:hypothetical protein
MLFLSILNEQRLFSKKTTQRKISFRELFIVFCDNNYFGADALAAIAIC